MKSFLKKRGKSSETTSSGLLPKNIKQTDTKCKGKGEKRKKTISEAKPCKSTERLIKCRHVAREMRETKTKPEKVLQNIFPKIEECKSDSDQNIISQERKHFVSRQHPTSPSSDRKYNSIRKQNLLTLIASNKDLTHLDELERRTLRAKSTDKKKGTCSSKDSKKVPAVPEEKEALETNPGVQASFPKASLLNDDTPSSSGIGSFVTATDMETDIMEMCKVRGVSISVSNEEPSSEVTRDISVLKLDCREEKAKAQDNQSEEGMFSNEENRTGFSKSYHKKQLPLTQDSNLGLGSTMDKIQDSALSKLKISQSNTYLLDFLKGNNLPLNLEARKRLMSDAIESIASTEPPCNGCKSKIDADNNQSFCVCGSGRSHVIHKPRLQKNKVPDDGHKETEQKLSFQTENCDEPKRELTSGKSPPSKHEDEINITNQIGAVEEHANHKLTMLEKIERTKAKNCLKKEKQSTEQPNNNLECIKTRSISSLQNVCLEITALKFRKPTDPSSTPSDRNQDEKSGPRNPAVELLTRQNHVDNFAKMPVKKIEHPAEQTSEQTRSEDSEVRPSLPSGLFTSDTSTKNRPEESGIKQPQVMESSESIVVQSLNSYVPNEILTKCSGTNLHQSPHHEDFTTKLLINETHPKTSREKLTDLVSVSSDTPGPPDNLQASNLDEYLTKESEESKKESPSSYIIVYPDKNIIRSPQTLVEKALKLKANRQTDQFDKESEDTFLDEIRDICEEILEAKMQKLQKKVVVDEMSLTNSYEKNSSDYSNGNTNESRKSGDSKVSDGSQETHTSGCSENTEDSKDSQGSQSSQNTEDSKDSPGSKCSQNTGASQVSQDSNFSQSSQGTETCDESQVTFDSQQSSSGNEAKLEEISTTVCKTVSLQSLSLRVTSEVVQQCKETKDKKEQIKENQPVKIDCDPKNQERGEVVAGPKKLLGIATEKIETSTQTFVGHDISVNKENSKVPTERGGKLKRKPSYDHWVTVSRNAKLQNNDLGKEDSLREPGVSKTTDKSSESCDCDGRMFDSLEVKYCDLSPKSNTIHGYKSTDSIYNQRKQLVSSSEPSSKGKTSLDLINKDNNDPGKIFQMEIKLHDEPKETDLPRNGALEKKSELREKQDQKVKKCKFEPKNVPVENAKTPPNGTKTQLCESNIKSNLCKNQGPEVNKCKPECKITAEKDVKNSSESKETKVCEQKGSITHEKTSNDFVSPNSPNKLNPCSNNHLLTNQAPPSNNPLNLNENTAFPSERPKTSNNIGDKKQVHPNKILRIDKNFKPNIAQESKFFGAQVVYRRDSKQSILNTTEGVLKLPASKDNRQNVTVLFEEVFPLPNQTKALRDMKSQDLKPFQFRHTPQLINANLNCQYMPKSFDAKKKSPIFSSVAPSPFRLQILPPVTKRQDLINKLQKVPFERTSLGICDAYYEAYNITTPNEPKAASKPQTTDGLHDLSNQQQFSDGNFSLEISGKPNTNLASGPVKLLKLCAEELNSTRICAENLQSSKLMKLRDSENGESNMDRSYQDGSENLSVKKSRSTLPLSPKPPKVFLQPFESELQHGKVDAQNNKSTKNNENYFDVNQRKSGVVCRIKSGDDLNSIDSSTVNPVRRRRSVGVGMQSSSRQNDSICDICSRCGSYIEESVKDSLENSTINSKDSDLVRFCETLHLKPVESETECELCNADSSSIVIRKTNDSKFHIPSNVNIFNQTSQDVCIACEVTRLKEKRESEAPPGICNTPEKKRKKRQDSKHTVHFDPKNTVEDDDSKSVNPVQTCTSFIYSRTWNKDLPEPSPVKVNSEPTTCIQKVNENGKCDEVFQKNLESNIEISSSQLRDSNRKQKQPTMAVKPSYSCCPSLERTNEPKSEKMGTNEAVAEKDPNNLIVLPLSGCRANVYIDEPGMYQLHLVLPEADINPIKKEESSSVQANNTPPVLDLCSNPNDSPSDSDQA